MIKIFDDTDVHISTQSAAYRAYIEFRKVSATLLTLDRVHAIVMLANLAEWSTKMQTASAAHAKHWNPREAASKQRVLVAVSVVAIKTRTARL